MYEYSTHIKLHDTDASGVIYFANQLRIAHEAFEAYFDSIGSSVRDVIVTKDFLLPIVHAASDFKAPLNLGDEITVQVRTERVGETSITMAYRFVRPDGTETGTARTVHVAIDGQTKRSIPLPDNLREAVTALLR